MDAKTLFQEGVVAIRDQKDSAKGRDLLMQSLRIEPKNEMAWLWLSRTMDEPQKKIQCLERALKLNPTNEQTKALISKLSSSSPSGSNGSASAPSHTSAPTRMPPPSAQAKAPAPPKNETSDWNALRISTNEMKAVGGNSLNPQVSADMEDMGLTPDLGAVLNVTSEVKGVAIKRATSEVALAEAPEPYGGLKDLRETYGESEPSEPAKAAPRKKLTPAETTQIKNYLTQAQALLNKNKTEEAIEQWVRVLEIEVDNEVALGNAVRYLSRLKYIDDARELVWDALNSGTTHPSIYLTAIDIAKYQGQEGEADELRLKLVQLPEAGEKTVLSVVDHFVENAPQKALEALDLAIPVYPKNQKLTFRRAQLAETMGLRKEAATYYEEAAQLGTRSKEGQIADKKLTEFMPHQTDKERGSILLALREALGIGFVYILMAFQDAGLNLFLLGPSRVAGIILSIVGGYLLVTATSSPQQKPIASWFGGSVPAPKPKAKKEDGKEDVVEAVMGDPEDETQLPMIPTSFRVVIGIAGAVLLVTAFVLVFSTAITLLRNGSPKPFYVPTIEDLINSTK